MNRQTVAHHQFFTPKIMIGWCWRAFVLIVIFGTSLATSLAVSCLPGGGVALPKLTSVAPCHLAADWGKELPLWEWIPATGKSSTASQAPLFVVPRGQSLEVMATLLNQGSPPDQNSPYVDYLTGFHVRLPDGRESIVFLQTLRNRELTPASRLAVGDKVRLRLSNWEDSGVGSLKRGELDDLELQLATPNFGQLLGGEDSGSK